MPSITSTNSVLVLGVKSVFPVPQHLQGFATDDAYSIENVEVAEVVLGVDGIMSSGYIPQIKTMNISLQADSASNGFFEAWYANQEANREIYQAFGVVTQESVGRIYTLTNGVLSNYSPLAEAKKTLGARKFQIKWNMVLGAPV